MNALRVHSSAGVRISANGVVPTSLCPGRAIAMPQNRPCRQRLIALKTASKTQLRTRIVPPPTAASDSAAEDAVEFPDEAIPTSSGYLPISGESKSRLFYVFYEASHNARRPTDTPIMVWLNGGPGCSSLIGCFYELGPWRLSEQIKLHRNDHAWNRRCGLLFIDQPIGVGFSIAALSSEIPTDEYTVAAHLFYALQYWIAQNPALQKRPIFVAGESYAGKYVPALAYYMLTHNQEKQAFGQFAGIAIGNGLTDPRIQIAQAADTAFYLGIIDEAQSVLVRAMARDLIELIDKASWLEATLKNLELVMYIYKASGLATLLDIRRTTRYHHTEDGVEFLSPFMNSAATKAALKIERGSSSWSSSRPIVKKAMAPDVMKSTKWMVEAVLRAGYPVLLYQGVYDAKDGPACNEAWMRTIVWDHIKSFWDSKREVWRVNRKLAGYWRRWKNLSHVVVLGAGHEVPYDQPMFAQDMIERWMASSLSPENNNLIKEAPHEMQDQSPECNNPIEEEEELQSLLETNVKIKESFLSNLTNLCPHEFGRELSNIFCNKPLINLFAQKEVSDFNL